VLLIAQAFGRTQLSVDSPEINSENLLVLLLPLILIYGVGLFYLLLDQLVLPLPQLRYLVISLFGVFASLPLIFAFLPPRTSPVAYPPYWPPIIQLFSGWMKKTELAMSDIPSGVAWYGDRQCMLLTLNAQKDFLAVHDFQKPIAVLYLTPATTDSRFVSDWVQPKEGWGGFVIECISRSQVPAAFPLSKTLRNFWPEQLIFTDSERWAHR
jgi:hypothetical protein